MNKAEIEKKLVEVQKLHAKVRTERDELSGRVRELEIKLAQADTTIALHHDIKLEREGEIRGLHDALRLVTGHDAKRG